MIDKSNFLGKTSTPKTRGGSRPASRSASINRERSDSSSRFSTKEPEGFVWAPLSSQNPNHYIWAPLSQEDLFDNSVKDLPINVKPRLSKKTEKEKFHFSSKESLAADIQPTSNQELDSSANGANNETNEVECDLSEIDDGRGSSNKTEQTHIR